MLNEYFNTSQIEKKKIKNEKMYYLCSNTQCNTTGLKTQGALSPFRVTMCLCCFPHSPSQTQPSSVS